jgi:hypothetical protein
MKRRNNKQTRKKRIGVTKGGNNSFLQNNTVLSKCIQSFSNFPEKKVIPLSDANTQKVLTKLKMPIPECCKKQVSYYDILQTLSKNFTEPIYIVGGAVRDFMQTEDTSTMNDIDINYTINPAEVETLLSTNFEIINFYKDKRNYIRVGPKSRADYLEGFYVKPQTYEPYTLECKMNSLMFCISKDAIHLIDLFGGAALEQAKQKIWEAPTTDYREWFKAQPKLLWRLVKFELRGYTVPLETKQAVYTYWIQNKDSISDYYWQNMWWTLNPELIQKIMNQIFKDCKEVNQDYYTLFDIFLEKKLIIANKV